MSKKTKPKHEDPALAAWFQSLSLEDKFAAANYLKNTAGNARAALKMPQGIINLQASVPLPANGATGMFLNVRDLLEQLFDLIASKLEVLDPILKAAAPVKVKKVKGAA